MVGPSNPESRATVAGRPAAAPRAALVGAAGLWVALLGFGGTACTPYEPPPAHREAPAEAPRARVRGVDPDRCVEACVREGIEHERCRRFCLAGMEEEASRGAGEERPGAGEEARGAGEEPPGGRLGERAPSPEAPEPGRGLKIIAPPGGGVYLGAYNHQNSGVAEFERALGTKAALFGMGVGTECRDGGTEGTLPNIDIRCREALWLKGYVTSYGIEAALKEGAAFTNQDLLDGRIDSALRQVARDIAHWGRPIFWFYQREPRFQFGGYGLKGNLRQGMCAMPPEARRALEPPEPTRQQLNHPCNYDQYGDRTRLDGPERYVAVARHIHDVVEDEIRRIGKESNITWVMGGVVEYLSPGFYTQHYPGDSYVDWHAFDWYPWPPSEYTSLSRSPGWREAMRLAPHKPILLMEFGVSHGEGRSLSTVRATWFQSFVRDVSTNPAMKNLAAVLYWQDVHAKTRLAPGYPDAGAWRREIEANPRFWHSRVSVHGAR